MSVVSGQWSVVSGIEAKILLGRFIGLSRIVLVLVVVLVLDFLVVETIEGSMQTDPENGRLAVGRLNRERLRL